MHRIPRNENFKVQVYIRDSNNYLGDVYIIDNKETTGWNISLLMGAILEKLKPSIQYFMDDNYVNVIGIQIADDIYFLNHYDSTTTPLRKTWIYSTAKVTLVTQTHTGTCLKCNKTSGVLMRENSSQRRFCNTECQKEFYMES